MRQTSDFVAFARQSQIRAAFAVATLFTCGLALIPWVIWEVVKEKV